MKTGSFILIGLACFGCGESTTKKTYCWVRPIDANYLSTKVPRIVIQADNRVKVDGGMWPVGMVVWSESCEVIKENADKRY